MEQESMIGDKKVIVMRMAGGTNGPKKCQKKRLLLPQSLLWMNGGEKFGTI
jgi:hypothetical protein